jgi:hypothetical protein
MRGDEHDVACRDRGDHRAERVDRCGIDTEGFGSFTV